MSLWSSFMITYYFNTCLLSIFDIFYTETGVRYPQDLNCNSILEYLELFWHLAFLWSLVTSVIIISIVKIITLITLSFPVHFLTDFSFIFAKGLKLDVRSLCHSSEYSMLGPKYLPLEYKYQNIPNLNIWNSNLMLDVSNTVWEILGRLGPARFRVTFFNPSACRMTHWHNHRHETIDKGMEYFTFLDELTKTKGSAI